MDKNNLTLQSGEINVTLPFNENNITAIIFILEGMKEKEIFEPVSSQAISDKPEKLKEKKLLKVTKDNHKSYKKRKGNKWSEEVFEFIKDNLKLKNREIAEKINKKFKLNITEKNLGVQMAHQGINRKNIKGKKVKKKEYSSQKDMEIIGDDDPTDEFDTDN